MVWPDSVSEWCFGASLVAFVGVIGVSLAAPLVLAAGADGTVDVLWKAVQFGFVALVVTFLLGLVCTLVENVRGERSGRPRL